MLPVWHKAIIRTKPRRLFIFNLTIGNILQLELNHKHYMISQARKRKLKCCFPTFGLFVWAAICSSMKGIVCQKVLNHYFFSILWHDTMTSGVLSLLSRLSDSPQVLQGSVSHETNSKTSRQLDACFSEVYTIHEANLYESLGLMLYVLYAVLLGNKMTCF